MPQAFEQCNQGYPRSADSLASMCWPITRQSQPMTVMEQSAFSQDPKKSEVAWPVAEPWRRNLEQPRCGGEGRCQGDAQRCNSKYRYGVDNVGQCPSNASCKSGYSCPPCDQPCADPCTEGDNCNRRTSRCFEWPQPRAGLCPNEGVNLDFRPKPANLNVEDEQPERCPTCKRCVVDMQCGPLSYNY